MRKRSFEKGNQISAIQSTDFFNCTVGSQRNGRLYELEKYFRSLQSAKPFFKKYPYHIQIYIHIQRIFSREKLDAYKIYHLFRTCYKKEGPSFRENDEGYFRTVDSSLAGGGEGEERAALSACLSFSSFPPFFPLRRRKTKVFPFVSKPIIYKSLSPLQGTKEGENHLD